MLANGGSASLVSASADAQTLRDDLEVLIEGEVDSPTLVAFTP